MSTINTSGIDANYPVPGINNSSQGFRDNFVSIKNNLNLAASELTDIQTKAVVKAALDNTTLNNDMANTLISNAAIRSFRSTTYNLGNSLSGTVLVNAALGDVQYGTISGDVTLQFTGWGPEGTQSNVSLQLAVSNTLAVVSFPSQVVFANNNFGVTVLENYANVASVPTVTTPYGVDQLNYRLATVDCGNSITIEPYNRPKITTQLQKRTPTPVGFQGDVAGTACVDAGISQIFIANTYANDEILTSNTTSDLAVNMPVVFTGIAFGGITAGNTYYVATIPTSSTFTIASTVGGANVNLSAANAASSGNMYANPITNMYICTATYNATPVVKTATDTTITTNEVKLNTVSSLIVNAPIIFTGTAFGGVTANSIYYIKSIVGGNTAVTLSNTRVSGVAGPVLTLTTATGTMTATSFNGSDIWKKIPLTPW